MPSISPPRTLFVAEASFHSLSLKSTNSQSDSIVPPTLIGNHDSLTIWQYKIARSLPEDAPGCSLYVKVVHHVIANDYRAVKLAYHYGPQQQPCGYDKAYVPRCAKLTRRPKL